MEDNSLYIQRILAEKLVELARGYDIPVMEEMEEFFEWIPAIKMKEQTM